MNSPKESVISGFIWRFAERFGAQLVSFLVSLVLARLLSPNDYGTIALVTVFTSILNVFIDSGLGTALIQKKDADNLDFSTVFYFNIIACTIAYIGLFLLSPAIARFYDRTDLIPVIRVLALTLVISGVKNVQQAYVSRNMLFKKFFFSTLGGTLGAAVVGVVLAYEGFGVWALVAQQIFNATVDTVILWITVKWRPSKVFSWERFKILFGFGWKMLIASLVGSIYSQMRQLIIGKIYTTSDLAYYNQGEKIPTFITANINTSIDSVLLPAMSNEQNNIDGVKKMTRKSIQISVFVLAPVMIGLAAISKNFVEFLLTEKWLPCVPYMCVFCLTYVFYPIHTCNLNAIKALGRSDLFLKLEIIKTVVGIIIVICTMRFGVWAICLGGIVSSVASQIINAWPNKRLLNYSYFEQLKDIIPTLALSSVMGVIVWTVGKFVNAIWASLILQIFTGIVFYILGSWVMKIQAFEYLCGVISKSRQNRKIEGLIKKGR